jgi:hypothetical protein
MMVAKKIPAMMGTGRLKRAASKKASSCVLSPISAKATTPVDIQKDSMNVTMLSDWQSLIVSHESAALRLNWFNCFSSHGVICAT